MADVTHLTTDVASMTEEIPSSVQPAETRNRKGYLSKPYADYCSSQKLQIELFRLKFLKDCKTCKRPSPSLRIRGASAIKDDSKLKLFSCWESELLDIAIKDKMTLIKKLKKSRIEQNETLSERDKKGITDHFEKKLAFYMSQNKTKWKDWPNKKCEKKKVKNFKRRLKRRKKRTEEDANKAIESGSVVVLVNRVVPPGAIAVLGRG